jgi:hypothetical protein
VTTLNWPPYNVLSPKCFQLDISKKKKLFMAYIRITTFSIDGTTIHPNLSIPLNCKYLPSLSLRMIRQFGKKYDQLQLIMLNEI